MKLRVLLVDDEEPARLRIRDLLADVPDVEVCGEAGNGRDAVSLARTLRPDLLILDIEMPGMSGFEVIEELAEPPLFLFATAYDEYAIRAFEVASLDYLLKPFGKQRLLKAVERARERLARGADPTADAAALLEARGRGKTPRRTRFTSRKGSRVMVLSAREITHFLVEDTILFACRGNERHPLQGTLEALEEELDPERFFRCHRSVIVNLDWVKEIRPLWKGSHVIELKVESSPRLPLSRRQARLLRERFPW